MDETFYVIEEDFGYFGLECLKPAYGLNDAPLAWQLCLHESLEESGGQQSVLDENCWHWKDAEKNLRAIITTHVDDIAVAADDQFMREQYAYLCKKFGKITVQEVPFTHCGCRYSKIKNGYKIDQQEFVDALKTQTINDIADPERVLTEEETTQFRSVLSGWSTMAMCYAAGFGR